MHLSSLKIKWKSIDIHAFEYKHGTCYLDYWLGYRWHLKWMNITLIKNSINKLNCSFGIWFFYQYKWINYCYRCPCKFVIRFSWFFQLEKFILCTSHHREGLIIIDNQNNFFFLSKLKTFDIWWMFTHIMSPKK